MVSGTRDDNTELDVNEFTLALSGRHYWRPASKISPYTHLSIIGSAGREVRKLEAGQPGWNKKGIGVDVALGLEWFPLKGVSAGAHAGVGFMDRSKNHPLGTSGTSLGESDTHYGIAHSGLQIRLYF